MHLQESSLWSLGFSINLQASFSGDLKEKVVGWQRRKRMVQRRKKPLVNGWLRRRINNQDNFNFETPNQKGNKCRLMDAAGSWDFTHVSLISSLSSCFIVWPWVTLLIPAFCFSPVFTPCLCRALVASHCVFTQHHALRWHNLGCTLQAPWNFLSFS